jgi:flagellar basal-body rod protein FlgB
MDHIIELGQTADMLKNAMHGASESHAVFANNIANVNTPNFKRTDVSFKQELAQSVPQTPDPDELQMAVTNDKDITTDPTAAVIPFAVTTNVDDTQQLRVDGSNVDIDQEMAKLSLNAAYRQSMGQMLGVQYTRIREAIQEHA